MSAHRLPALAPLHSAQWFRVAALRPLLHARVTSQRQVQRGEVWQVLSLPDGSRSFRLNAAAWSVVARCNGQRSTQQLWDMALADCGDAAPTQDELLSILSRLHHAGLLSFDQRPDFGASSTGAQVQPELSPHRRNSWMAWRIPLGRPDAWLQRWALRLAPLPVWPAFAVWLVAVTWAVLTAVAHAPALGVQMQGVLMSAHSWGLALLAYPLLKLLHEAAHGLAARRLGAPVSEWGITLLMLVPVPYVDVSAASALPGRRQRMRVAGAGMMAEGAVAAAALAVWLNVQPGSWRDAALLVFFLAGLSTVLVNANPLLRFDGYHLLCDALNLPNLATRSSRYTLQRLARVVLAHESPGALVPAAGEKPWLLFYAPAALVMRWLIAWAVILWLGSLSHVLGLIVAALFLWGLVAAPAFKLLRWLRSGALRAGGAPRWRQHGMLLMPLLLLAAAVLWPMPVSTVAQGVMWLPEHALVRSQATGMVGEVLVADGQLVQPGDAVVQLVSPALRSDVERLQGLVQQLLAEQVRTLQAEPAQAIQAEHRLQATLAELAQSEERLAKLTVRAQAHGRIVIERAADWPGRHVQRGALLAHVITGEPGIVQVAIPHDRAARLGERDAASGMQAFAAPVQVLAADPGAAPRWAHWVGKPSGGVTQLPSAALGDRSGGRITTDAADRSGLRPAQPVLVGELQLEGASAHRLGERVLVRFEQGRAPLLLQLADHVQKQLLHHFNPST
jgi:putative peptide zinc metalloprotease protein